MRLTALRYMKLAPVLKELRIHYCRTGDSSEGVREFISKNYPMLQKENPDLSILIRESHGIKPRLWARYDKGKETSVPLANLKVRDILKAIESVGK